ncbi:hypothetical protein [Streptomyces luteogriseus]|uniref:hypothetical protein n=1 Tax=Streptomyces luteogriseus TaxID=68233 RepID=UPI0036F02C8B
MPYNPAPGNIGQRAYAAYAESTGGLTHDGKQMPPWEDLGDAVQTAWNAAAYTVWNAAQDGGR